MKRAFAGALMALLAAIPGVAAAQALAFGPMLSDGAVLQRGQPIELAGQAAPGARVTVDLGGAARTVTAGPDGRWTAAFP
ncbi:MAG: sialate O-acetylesterase, partial [Sphingomonadaceae bacterium]|nr:sialate O-acetylesterase [Sphingomonadaceae bacterium]